VLLDQLFKGFQVFIEFACVLLINSVPRHRDAHDDTSRVDLRVDFLEPPRRDLCLEVVFSLAVLKGEQALAHRVAVAHSPVVNKSDIFIAPTEEVSTDLAAKRARAEEQTLALLQDVEVELRGLPPLHESEVEADRLLGERAWIHKALQLDHSGLDRLLPGRLQGYSFRGSRCTSEFKHE